MPFPRANAEMEMKAAAFTLIELLVVITIIAVLMGLAFPVFQAVQNAAKKTQAKNDLVQIVTAVNAYYTEYGKYPVATQGSDRTLPPDEAQEDLMDTLRGTGGTLNPRNIVFFSPPTAKDSANPRAGIGLTDRKLHDPWGGEYRIRIDGNYDNDVSNPYSSNAGSTLIRSGVIAWSFGKDLASQTSAGPTADKNATTNKDDVISWQ